MDIRLIGPPMAPPVELLRWLMERHAVPYRFEPRAAGLHAWQQRRLNMPVELPLMITPEGSVGGLRPSLAHLEARLGQRGDTLYSEAGDADWVEALMTPLFPACVKSFYWHMLADRAAILPSATDGVPWADRWFLKLAFPGWRKLMRSGLQLETFVPADAETAIWREFDRVAAELGSRRYLGGAAPGIRDMVFAVMASPVLLPSGHPARLPDPARLPPAFRDLVARARAHPAGQHALKVYAGSRQVY